MRKKYPYLQEQYIYNLNEEQKKRQFLSKLDAMVNQHQYVLFTLLDWDENPLKEIQGEITGGSISIDGASAVRRTGSLSCTIGTTKHSIDSLMMDFSLKNKVFVEVGVRNDTGEYEDWPILWFPQGVFIITDFSMNSSSSSAINVTITLKDKMCLLNGDIGGQLPASVQFDSMDTQLPNGSWTQQKVLIYNIILELVNHYGGEQIPNIIIQDVPLRIRQVMKWNGKNNIYAVEKLSEIISPTNREISIQPSTLSGKKLSVVGPQYAVSRNKIVFASGALVTKNILSIYDTYQEGNDESTLQDNVYIEEFYFTLDKPQGTAYRVFKPGMDVGYIYKDFVITDELVGAAGASITSILDEIKDKLGNYEYFYDVFGIFHFREIKNYLNITQAQIVEEEMNNPGRRIVFSGGNFLLDEQSENQYLIETTNEKTLYSFNDDQNITSITVTPQYQNIKNDYVIEGLRQGTSTETKQTVRYHLAIDEKPQIIHSSDQGDYYGYFENVVFYTDTSENQLKRVNKLGIIPSGYQFSSFASFPVVGNMDMLYYDKANKESYFWNNTSYKRLVLITEENGEEVENAVKPRSYYARDWRTFLYLYGLEANANGTDPGYYFTELAAFWPLEYDLDPDNQQFFGEKNAKSSGNKDIYFDLTTGNFFLDFIDANSTALGEYSVQAIGRRQDIVSQENINCLFLPDIPNVIFLNVDDPEQNWTENTAGRITDEELNLRWRSITESEVNPNSLTRESKLIALQRYECIINTQPYTQINSEIYSNLLIGGYLNSAYEAIRYELFCHTRYQKKISLTSLPVFYLDVNSRVELNSKSTQTSGDFMVQNINFSFGPGATMSVVLNEVAERL